MRVLKYRDLVPIIIRQFVQFSIIANIRIVWSAGGS